MLHNQLLGTWYHYMGKEHVVEVCYYFIFIIVKTRSYIKKIIDVFSYNVACQLMPLKAHKNKILLKINYKHCT